MSMAHFHGSSRVCRLKSSPARVVPRQAVAGARRKSAAKRESASKRLARKVAKRPTDVGGLYSWFDAMVIEHGKKVAVSRLSAFSKKTRAWQPALVLGYCLFGLGRSKAATQAFQEAYRRWPG